MFKVRTLNKIAKKGLDMFSCDNYEVASEFSDPDAVLLRSFKMHDMELKSGLKAVGRAGAGVNNIPISKCTDQGVVVFNTPGANANAVKELVISGLLLASRDIIGGAEWVQGIADQGADVPKLVEKGKSNFAGSEVKGKKLAVIGLGAIGRLVANAATSLGMEVVGYDPYISVENAWMLSRNVKNANGMESLLADADYITLHMPLIDATRGFLNKDRFAVVKKGVKVLNFSRNELVNNADLADAIEEGIVAKYVTDFPNAELLALDKVLCLPHLGASTLEAEENCATMVSEQVQNYLEYGVIKNSVNYPDVALEVKEGTTRVAVSNKNVPNMLGQMSTALAEEGLNIVDMINKSRNDLAYTLIDLDGSVSEKCLDGLKAIDGVIRVRVVY